MNKKTFLFGLALLSAGLLTTANADVDYTKLKINEVSGVGSDSEKFYELINTGDVDIPLENCKLYYNANSEVGNGDNTSGQPAPTEKGTSITWTGCDTQTLVAGGLFLIKGRNKTPSGCVITMSSGLTAQRSLRITLEDPAGNEIDVCVRNEDRGDYAISDKSFSRIPDGTGPFYFTSATENATNGSDATGLLALPTPATGIIAQAVSAVSIYPNPVKDLLTVSGAKGTISVYDVSGALLQSAVAAKGATTLDVSALAAGVYLLQVDGKYSKFIKQ